MKKLVVLVSFVYIFTFTIAASSATIPLQRGYNLISVPFSSAIIPQQNDCAIDRIWSYYDGSYVSAVTGSSPIGVNFASFFVYTRTPCTLNIENADSTRPLLSKTTLAEIWDDGGGAFNFKKGWNFFAGFTDSPLFEDVKGNCTVTKGPYGYDAAGRRWTDASTLDENKGYIVKISEDCGFGYTTESGLPPLPP
ncbi:MAG: hypothetical protein V1861_00845 [Candidatus Micrarchaeota archaeon]